MPAFFLFSAGIYEKFNITTNTSLGNYNQTKELINLSREIRNSTDFRQDAGVLDVIGGYFSKAIAALKVVAQSVDIYITLGSQTAQDVPYFATFQEVMTAIVLIMLIVGVIITAYIKWKV